MYKIFFIAYKSCRFLFYDMMVNKQEAKRLVTNRKKSIQQADDLKIKKKIRTKKIRQALNNTTPHRDTWAPWYQGARNILD